MEGKFLSKIDRGFVEALRANTHDKGAYMKLSVLVLLDMGKTYEEIAEALGIGLGTNFHAIFKVAKSKYDRIVVLSDMQGCPSVCPPVPVRTGLGRAGMQGSAPMAPFAEYRRKYDASPFVYSFDLHGYGSLQFPEQSARAGTDGVELN